MAEVSDAIYIQSMHYLVPFLMFYLPLVAAAIFWDERNQHVE